LLDNRNGSVATVTTVVALNVVTPLAMRRVCVVGVEATPPKVSISVEGSTPIRRAVVAPPI
jgi:hypothetical protein